MQSQTWLILGIALATALLINTVNVCAAGTCDTEDFYPTYHVHSKFNSTSNENVIDTIVSLYYWTKKSKYFQTVIISHLTTTERLVVAMEPMKMCMTTYGEASAQICHCRIGRMWRSQIHGIPYVGLALGCVMRRLNSARKIQKIYRLSNGITCAQIM